MDIDRILQILEMVEEDFHEKFDKHWGYMQIAIYSDWSGHVRMSSRETELFSFMDRAQLMESLFSLLSGDWSPIADWMVDNDLAEEESEDG